MGANNLTFVAGGVIQTSHPNQYFTALSQDVVPRDASGVVTTAAGSLGSSTYKWDSIFLILIHFYYTPLFLYSLYVFIYIYFLLFTL
jgi:hypothetical protein